MRILLGTFTNLSNKHFGENTIEVLKPFTPKSSQIGKDLATDEARNCTTGILTPFMSGEANSTRDPNAVMFHLDPESFNRGEYSKEDIVNEIKQLLNKLKGNDKLSAGKFGARRTGTGYKTEENIRSHELSLLITDFFKELGIEDFTEFTGQHCNPNEDDTKFLNGESSLVYKGEASPEGNLHLSAKYWGLPQSDVKNIEELLKFYEKLYLAEGHSLHDASGKQIAKGPCNLKDLFKASTDGKSQGVST